MTTSAPGGVRRRTVVITGAAGHLGRAVAARFASAGWQLAMLDLHALPAGQRSLLPADRLWHRSVDLLDPAATRAAIDAARDGMGRIDALCNLAGGFRMGQAVHESDDAAFDALFGQNVRTLLHACAATVPHMPAAGGCIVNVGAAAAGKGTASMGLYQAAKCSVQRLTESMAEELRGHGIRVNAVLPSILDTPPNRQAMPGADPSRWVKPEALADVIHFLCGDGARAIHGACIPVTAGE